jgi:hypothetical protein
MMANVVTGAEGKNSETVDLTSDSGVDTIYFGKPDGLSQVVAQTSGTVNVGMKMSFLGKTKIVLGDGTGTATAKLSFVGKKDGKQAYFLPGSQYDLPGSAFDVNCHANWVLDESRQYKLPMAGSPLAFTGLCFDDEISSIRSQSVRYNPEDPTTWINRNTDRRSLWMQSSDRACGGFDDKDGTVTKCVEKFRPERGCVDTTCPHFATITDHADDTVKHYLQTLEIADGNETVFVINKDGELETNDGGDGVKYAVVVGEPDENNMATLTVTNNDDSSDKSINVTGVTVDMAEVNHQVKIVSTTTRTATTATASTTTASTITVTTGTNTTATASTTTATNMDKTFSFQLNMDIENTDGDILRKTIGEQLSTMMGGMNASEIIAGGTDAIKLKPGSIVASFETVTKVQKAALEDDVTTLIVGVVKQYRVNYKLSLITTLEPVETTASSAPVPSDAAVVPSDAAVAPSDAAVAPSDAAVATAGEDAPTTVAATEAPTTTNAAAAAVDKLDEDSSVEDIDAAQEALKADADKKKADAVAAAKALEDMADSADTDVADAIADTKKAADDVQAKVDEAQKAVDEAQKAAKAGDETAKKEYKEAIVAQAAALDEQETLSVQANAIKAASETKKAAEAATAGASALDAKVAAEVQNKKDQVDDATAKVAAALQAVSKASKGTSVADKKAANEQLTKANTQLETSSGELNDAVTEASTANAMKTQKAAEAAVSTLDAKVADNEEVQDKLKQVDDAKAKVAAALQAVSDASKGTVADKNAAIQQLTKANTQLETSTTEFNDAVTKASKGSQRQPGCTSDDSDDGVYTGSKGNVNDCASTRSGGWCSNAETATIALKYCCNACYGAVAQAADKKSDDNTPIIAAVVVVVVLLIAVVIVVIVLKGKKTDGSNGGADRAVVSFENPMYDGVKPSGGAPPPQGGATASSGYQDVGANNNGLYSEPSGYMDVAPNGQVEGGGGGQTGYMDVAPNTGGAGGAGGYMDVAPTYDDEDGEEDV